MSDVGPDKLPNTQPPGKPRRHKWLRRSLGVLLAGLLLFCSLAGILATSSDAQTQLARWLLAYVLPVDVALSGLDLTSQTASIASFTLHAEDRNAPALLEASQLHLAYSPRSLHGRYLNELSLESLTLRYEEDDAGQRNWDHLIHAYRSDPTSPQELPEDTLPLTPWLPEHTTISALNFEGKTPSWDLSLSPLAIDSRIDSPNNFTVHAWSDALKAQWALPLLDLPRREVEGNIDLQLERAARSWRLALDSHLPSLAEGTLSFQLEAEDAPSQAYRIDLDIPEMAVAAPVLLPLLHAQVPFPMHFATLSLQDTALSGSWLGAESTVDTARLHLTTEQLQIGPAEAPWYQGDLALHGEGRVLWTGETLEPTGHVDWVVDLQENPAIHLTTSGGFEKAALKLQIMDWNKANLESVLPPQYRNYLEHLPGLDGLESVQVAGDWEQSALQFTGEAIPHLKAANANAADYTLAIDTQLDVTQESKVPWLDGVLEMTSTEGAVQAQTTLDRDLQLHADMRLDAFNPASWLQDWLEKPWPEDLQSVLSGDAVYEWPLASDNAMHELKLDLLATTFAVGDYIFTDTSPIQITGDTHFNAATPIQGQQLTVQQPDSFTVEFDQWRTRYDPFRFSGTATAEADLSTLTGYLDFSALWGHVSATGPVVYEGSTLNASELTLRSEDFMWGDWSIPYGSTLALQGGFTLDWESRPQIHLTSPRLDMANSHVNAESMVLFFPQEEQELQFRINQVSLESDLAPIVRAGWLHSAQGSLQVQAPDLSYTENGLRGNFDATLEAEHLVLPESVAAMEGVQLTSNLIYNGAMNGSGELNLDSISVGGILVGATDSEVRFEENDLLIDDLVAQLLGGVLEGNATIGLLEPGLPVRIQGEVRDIDLERFTQEFEPPDIFLTGLVAGTLALEFDENGIVDLKANLESNEDFTLNRDMVEYLLLSEYVGDISGGRNLERVVQRTVGDAEQRQFDGAVLDLGFEEGRITGVAVLESRNLSLTFDIVADPEALIEALKIRQQEAM